MSPTAPSPTPPPTATWRPLNTLSTPRCRPSTPPATSRWPAPDYNPAPRNSWPPSIVNGTAWSRTATSRCCPWTTTPPNGRCALPSWAAKTSAAPVPAGLPNSPPASGPSPPPPTSPASTPSPTSPPTSTPAAPPAAHPSPQPTCNASCPGQPAPPIWPPGLPHHATITPPPPKQPSTRNRYTPRNPGCPSARPSCDSRILTMNEQLLRMALISGRTRYSIRVVLASAGPVGALGGPFCLMEYADHRPVAYVETSTSSLFLEEPREV